MKKFPLSLLLILPAFILLTGCNNETQSEASWRGATAGMNDLTAITERTEYYDIFAESEVIFHSPHQEDPSTVLMHQDVSSEGITDSILLGTQFSPEGPIQLRAKEAVGGTNIYLLRPDGSSRLLLEKILTYYTNLYSPEGGEWYLDPEGNIYCWRNANYLPGHTDPSQKNLFDSSIAKILPSGQVLFDIPLAPGIIIEDFCQLEDGSVYLLLLDQLKKSRSLVELNTESGMLSQVKSTAIKDPLLAEQYLGTDGASVTILNCETLYGYEILAVDITNGSSSTILSFTGTSYSMSSSDHSELPLHDFRVMEDGCIELLWLDSLRDSDVIYEKLCMAKVEKIPIVVRGLFKTDTWILRMAGLFNQSNDTYHIVLEDCGVKNNLEDFARLTSIQLAAGKGPDILYGDLMHDYITGLLSKGILEELTPYMEASGIREEDFFPCTFNVWRTDSAIYSVSPKMSIIGYQMASDILGSTTEPDIETLLDALLSRQDTAVFLPGFSAQQVLEIFLSGTESLWDMVDWEENTCDFDGPLFARLLETARRYGDDGKKSAAPSIAEYRFFSDVLQYKDLAAQESLGMVTCGIMFDDGCHGAMSSGFTMSINSSSPNKAGAWEFIRFLLEKEAQACSGMPPVNRAFFETWLEEKKELASASRGANVVITKITNGQVVSEESASYTMADFTEEKAAEYRTVLEESRPCPLRTAPILSIILEEAADYFNGSKNADQVSEIITNRVQVFLDENR